MNWVFWISVGLVAYTWLGFPLLVLLRAFVRRRPFRQHDHALRVSVIVAAYNEERHIQGRLENLLAQEHPADRLEIIVVSDGSSDGTAAIVRSYAERGVRLLEQPRQGKGIALNAAVRGCDANPPAAASGDVLVFTDANTEFSPGALRALVRPFADPQVGGAAGNQVYLRSDRRSRSADGERLYWSFDQALKRWQSAAGSITSATGAIYAVRRELFEPVPADAMDDFMISTGVIAQGRRLVYVPDAVAREPVAEAPGVEFQRKVRIVTQGLRGVFYRRRLLVPWKHGFYSLQLLTHKVLRRLMVFPLVVSAVAAASLWDAGWLYRGVAIAAVGLCALASVALVARGTRLGSSKLFTVPYYFFLVNAAVIVAVWNLVTRRGIRRWEPERHQTAPAVLLEKTS